MADTEFDLGEALGGYEQAQADRNFYLSMVQGGTQIASPIAAYLAGVSGVKMANMRAKAQAIEDKRQAEKDAIATTERMQKRADTLRGQLTSIVKGVSDGTIPASVGANLVGPIVTELGSRIKQYDPKKGTIVYNEGNDPTDYVWDWKESESSKAQRDLMKIALSQSAEDRKGKELEAKKNLWAAQANKILKGQTDKKSPAKTNEFLKANADFFTNVWEPKSYILKRQSLEERLDNYIGNDISKLRKWLRGIEELDEQSKEIFGEYTDLIQEKFDNLNNPNPKEAQLISNEKEQKSSNSISALELLRDRWNKR